MDHDRSAAPSPVDAAVPESVAMAELLPDARTEPLLAGDSWVSAIVLVKVEDENKRTGWAIRLAGEPLTSEELLGVFVSQADTSMVEIREDWFAGPSE